MINKIAILGYIIFYPIQIGAFRDAHECGGGDKKIILKLKSLKVITQWGNLG